MGTAAANHSNKLTFGSLGASEVGPAAEVGRPLSNSVHLLSAVANSAGKPPPDLKGKYPRREGKALLCSLPRRLSSSPRAQGRSDQTCARTWTVVND